MFHFHHAAQLDRAYRDLLGASADWPTGSSLDRIVQQEAERLRHLSGLVSLKSRLDEALTSGASALDLDVWQADVSELKRAAARGRCSIGLNYSSVSDADQILVDLS